MISRRKFITSTFSATAGGVIAGIYGKTISNGIVNNIENIRKTSLISINRDNESSWKSVRKEFIIEEGLNFFNCGTYGPIPKCVYEANFKVIKELAINPMDSYRRKDIEDIRKNIAGFINVHYDEVTLTRSTTEGMNIFAKGLDWRVGDEVIMTNHEHSGGYMPYLSLRDRKGILVKQVKLDFPDVTEDIVIKKIKNEITKKTRVIMVSHMLYTTGMIMPVKRICEIAHENGILVSVDGAHPLGMMDLNIQGLDCDHYAASGQKWLLSGPGTGVCYIKKNIQEEVCPLMGYPMIDIKEGNIIDTRRYEHVGQKNISSIYGLNAAVNFHKNIGKNRIQNRVKELAEYFRLELSKMKNISVYTPLSQDAALGLTTFSIYGKSNTKIKEMLEKKGNFILRTIPNEKMNAVRASIHIYNSFEQIKKMLGVIYEIGR